ncbi:uncharacterized protein LALA0_S01e16930g [Lachancea lanzarotensis]|uniref:LALA0S01e16930g1_1 n=1 Tax=Lachancea lanzarotensis TaxID=1245769 RepID=A0A0C7N2B1_9SACH|nr:uncharacterized protein LALA0_S01e16930g [Lachancea lanzarotensis]CEP60699.1 LALA0S01e16930g1_1 [Lachancea lanzarotensis]
MEAVWQSLDYGWLFVTTVAQILRLGLYSLVVVLLGPLAVLYVYDVGLYTWRVVVNRGKRAGPVFGPDQRALEIGPTRRVSLRTMTAAAATTTKASEPLDPNNELSNSPYTSDTDWDSITATSPAEFGDGDGDGGDDDTVETSFANTSALDDNEDATPRISGIQGSFTRFSDLITVTISAGAGDSTSAVENYDREIKLVSGRS